MSTNNSSKSAKLKVYYGTVSVSRNPVEELEVTTKRYVDGKIVVGDVKYSVRNLDHDGWLYCDGRSVSRTEYADLFSIIGTSFGSQSGTTFNLPNCKGRVIGAVGAGAGLTGRTLGDTVGAESHMMTTNQMPSHTHTGTTDSSGTHTHTITDPGHTHTQNTINDDFNNSGGSPPGFAADSAGSRTWSNINNNTTGITINSAGAHTHTFTTDATGSGQSFNIMQPTIFMGNVFIFAGI